MINRGWKFVDRLLAEKSFGSDHERNLYLVLSGMGLFAGLMHLTLMIIFFVAAISWLVTANAIGVLLCTACIVLVRCRRYTLAAILTTLDVVAYVLFSTVVIGAGTYSIVYLFLLLALHLTTPYASIRVRGAMVALLWVTLGASMLMGHILPPLHELGELRLTLVTLNLQITFVGLVLDLSLGNSLRSLISRLEDMRLEELEGQAYTDPLTGLFNRRYAEIFFRRIVDEKVGQSWCVALLDIDDFKKINDTYGHAAGDVVLTCLSNNLRKTLRKTDVLFRWGGEEFLILLGDVDLDTACFILDKVRKSIAEDLIRVNSQHIHVTATIGVEQLDPENTNGSIESCDLKMYEGKRNGKNQVVM